MITWAIKGNTDHFKKDTTEKSSFQVHFDTPCWNEPMGTEWLKDEDWEYAFTCENEKCKSHISQEVFDPSLWLDNRVICVVCGTANKINKESNK